MTLKEFLLSFRDCQDYIFDYEIVIRNPKKQGFKNTEDDIDIRPDEKQIIITIGKEEV